MITRIKHIVFFLIAFSVIANAQKVEVKLSPNISVPSTNWDNSKMEDIRKTIEGCLTEYAQYGTLFDEKEKKVTSNSIDNFHKLFFTAAKIVKDYVEHPPVERISIRDYSSGVYNLLQMYGVQFRIEEAVIQEIKYDPAGFYIPIVKVEKSIYNLVKSSGKVEVNSGRFFTQYFNFDVSVTNFDKVKITDIKGKDIAPPADFTRILDFQVSGFLPLVNGSRSQLWEDRQTSALNPQLASTGLLSGSGGVMYKGNRLTNSRKSKDKNLFWSIGAAFSFNRIRTSLDSFSIKPYRDKVTVTNTNGTTTDVNYWRYGDTINLKETLQFGAIEVPVGISYRLVKKRMFSAFVNAHFVPTLMMINTAQMQGSGTYDGRIGAWRFLRDGATNPELISADDGLGPFDVGHSITIKEETYDFSTNFLSFGVRVAPELYWDLTDYNPNWGIKAGLNVTYYLRNPIQAINGEEDMLRYSADVSESVLLHYSKSLRMLTAGFNIGLYYKINKEP